MADEKISAMPAAATLTGAELFAGVQSADNVKVTAQQIANFILAGTAGDFSVVGFNSSDAPDLTAHGSDGLLRLTAPAGPAQSGIVFFHNSDDCGNINGKSGTGFTIYSQFSVNYVCNEHIHLQPGGEVLWNSTTFLNSAGNICDSSGTPLLLRTAGQQAAIADASVDLADVVAQFNTLLAELRALNLIAT